MVFSWISGLIGQGTTTHPLDTVDVSQVDSLAPVGNVIRAKVIDVYDGDTVTILFQLGTMFFKEKLRLAGIDAPELRTRNETEKAAAIRSRDWLREQILNKHVHVYFRGAKKEKYGRLIGDVALITSETPDVPNTPPSGTINAKMVELGLAVAYDGGSKKPYVTDE